MIKSERRDYQIAILVSLVFHLILFLVYFPETILRKEMELTTYPVGIVSLSKSSGGLEPEMPNKIETRAFEEDPPAPESKPERKPNEPEPGKKAPETPKLKLPDQEVSSPVKDSVVKSPQPTGNPVTPAPDPGATVQTGGNTGGGKSLGPRGLGNGEDKVFQLGALPPYPKNALNEGVGGAVGIKILVFSNGNLERVDLVNSSGDSRLDRAALRAVSSWRFKPESEDYYIDIGFTFDIKNGVSVRFLKAETRP